MILANPYAPRRMSNKANLGKHLERLIDMTNRQYQNKGVADVRKVPTPVQIIKSLGGGRVEGRKEKAQWVDYVGVGHGRVLIFDAKETKKENLPLENLADHQFELLQSWYTQGACAFLIVSFAHKHEEIYLLPFKLLLPFWEAAKEGGRKSIPYSFFVENCDRIRSDRGYVLHYLKVLEGK